MQIFMGDELEAPTLELLTGNKALSLLLLPKLLPPKLLLLLRLLLLLLYKGTNSHPVVP